MDEFAQSREDDDLFADEFEPVNVPSVAVETSSGLIDDNKSTTDSGAGTMTTARTDETPRAKPPTGPSSHRNGRGGQESRDEKRMRGGRGGGQRSGLSQSRYAPASMSENNTSSGKDAGNTDSPPSIPTVSNASDAQTPNTESDSTPATNTQPSEQQANRPAAVRGDRHLTGGPAHKKLTEEELTLKLEKMKILNAQKSERFRLSEEDSAAYARKEKEIAKKRVEEQKAVRHQDMERAKNRQRKLQAQSGREWDSEKVESDIVDGRGRGRSSEYVRGGHGGVIRGAGGLAGSRYADAGEDNGVQSSRGRGGFEIRGRGSRGGRGGGSGNGGKTTAPVPGPDDFPELPTPSKILATEKLAGDWAEEMATPVEEKKIDV